MACASKYNPLRASHTFATARMPALLVTSRSCLVYLVAWLGLGLANGLHLHCPGIGIMRQAHGSCRPGRLAHGEAGATDSRGSLRHMGGRQVPASHNKVVGPLHQQFRCNCRGGNRDSLRAPLAMSIARKCLSAALASVLVRNIVARIGNAADADQETDR